jgi:RNA polymerase sigma factor (sigma-70 family)
MTVATWDPLSAHEPIPIAESFDDFYRRCRPGMIGLAYVVAGPDGDHEAIVQDSFASVYAGYVAGRLREPEFYLKRVVVNRCRRWKGSQAIEREHRAFGEPERTDADIDSLATKVLIEDSIVNEDALVQALGRLREEHRTALVLRYLEDLPVDRIAELMGRDGSPIATVTIRSWIYRGLHHLKEALS